MQGSACCADAEANSQAAGRSLLHAAARAKARNEADDHEFADCHNTLSRSAVTWPRKSCCCRLADAPFRNDGKHEAATLFWPAASVQGSGEHWIVKCRLQGTSDIIYSRGAHEQEQGGLGCTGIALKSHAELMQETHADSLRGRSSTTLLIHARLGY